MRTKRRATRKSNVFSESDEEVADKPLEEEVTLGDVIWVKIHGDSWWPAQVVDENTVSGSNKTGKKSVRDVLVRLYGSYEYLYADPVQCRFNFEMKLNQNEGSSREIFEKALEQDRHCLKSGRSKGQRSKTTGAARITGTKKAGGSVSEKEGKPQHSAEKNTLVRVSPRRQLNATTRQSKVNNGNLLTDEPAKDKTHNQDRVQKKRKQNSQSAEEVAKGKSSGQDDKKQGSVHKEIKQNSRSAKEEAKSKIHKQAEVQKKVKSNVTVVEEGRGSKISKQDEGQNKLKRNDQSAAKQDELNSPSSGMDPSGNSHELSARRRRVMQNLALAAPLGSPFHKNGHNNPSL